LKNDNVPQIIPYTYGDMKCCTLNVLLKTIFLNFELFCLDKFGVNLKTK